MKCRFSLSYRDLEEIAYIRGAVTDHSTLQKWIIKFIPLLDRHIRKRNKHVGSSWRMDETYIKLSGSWVYLYRAVDSIGNTIKFLLRKHRDQVAVKAFFCKAFKNNKYPEKIKINKSGSSSAALNSINKDLTEDTQVVGIDTLPKEYLDACIDLINKKVQSENNFVG